MAKFTPIKDLSCEAIESMPVDFDWSTGYGETWECIEATRCEKCSAAVISYGETRHCNITDPETDEYPECEGYVPRGEGPTMGYYYPVDIDDERKAAIALADTCLCVVTVNGQTGLALTGGGMDLSWEIAGAFVTLGFLPPVHFSGLPAVCGKGTSPRDIHTAKAAMRSIKVAKGWLDSKAEATKRSMEFAKSRKK